MQSTVDLPITGRRRQGRTVPLDREQWADIDRLAMVRQISGAAIVREAVREYLADERQREALAA